jgi:N-glycosylase/DNA lyase
MKKIICDRKFFDVKDTLECGQVFRFIPYKQGFLIFTLDKCAYVYHEGKTAVIECEDGDSEYFTNYFDLGRDYSKIVSHAQNSGVEILKIASESGKGIRILNQDITETLFSFIVSQNNNIPRIKGIIEKLCLNLGEKKNFNGIEYFAFPTVEKMAKSPLDFYKSIGLGYRAEYILRFAQSIDTGLDITAFSALETIELKKELLKIYGVGPKVADCVLFFGYKKSDSFPVDTWIEKVYREDFGGNIKDRAKIAEWFVEQFKENSGYFQQYLFHFKRKNQNDKEK